MVTLRVRYSFTAQYLRASALFARRCADIERANPDNLDHPSCIEHRGLVTAAIMQSAAAVEAESAELTMHGPGHHLGSDRLDRKARDYLAPLADFIDDQDALTRYKLMLHLLGRPDMPEGQQPWQHMSVLVKLRNELVHYKSKWHTEMETQRFYTTLKQLRFPRPPFIPENTAFFPLQFLSAPCAAWAVRTAVAFLNGFYERLGIDSPLKSYMSEFADL